jgi:hypothetical protein
MGEFEMGGAVEGETSMEVREVLIQEPGPGGRRRRWRSAARHQDRLLLRHGRIRSLRVSIPAGLDTGGAR